MSENIKDLTVFWLWLLLYNSITFLHLLILFFKQKLRSEDQTHFVQKYPYGTGVCSWAKVCFIFINLYLFRFTVLKPHWQVSPPGKDWLYLFDRLLCLLLFVALPATYISLFLSLSLSLSLSLYPLLLLEKIGKIIENGSHFYYTWGDTDDTDDAAAAQISICSPGTHSSVRVTSHHLWADPYPAHLAQLPCPARFGSKRY